MFTLNEVGKSGVLLFCAITIMASSADGQTDVMAALLKASRRGDLSALAESVKQGADINGSDPNGNTALILAAEHGHFPAMPHESARQRVSWLAERRLERRWISVLLGTNPQPRNCPHQAPS